MTIDHTDYLGPEPATRHLWLRERAWGITATDLPAIMGVDQWTTLDQLVARKRLIRSGITPSTVTNEAAEWGLRLEEPIAQAWRDRYARPMWVSTAGLHTHIEHDWMRCTPDRLVWGCLPGTTPEDSDPSCLLEIKTRSADQADRWIFQPPADVIMQVQWQLAVTGYHHVHVVCLLGGNRLIEHMLLADDELHQRMIAAAGYVQAALDRGVDVDVAALEHARAGLS